MHTDWGLLRHPNHTKPSTLSAACVFGQCNALLLMSRIHTEDEISMWTYRGCDGSSLGRKIHWQVPWQAVKDMAKGQGVPSQMQYTKSLWLVFMEVRDCALPGGSYVSYCCPIYLMVMSSGLLFQKVEQHRLSILMQLHNLPIECWTTKALSKLASYVGKCLYTNKLTKSRRKISFTHVMVKVDISWELLESLPATLVDGTKAEIQLHFESQFKFCLMCTQM